MMMRWMDDCDVCDDGDRERYDEQRERHDRVHAGLAEHRRHQREHADHAVLHHSPDDLEHRLCARLSQVVERLDAVPDVR